MITYGYAIQYKYTNDNTLHIQTRIPSIHGPMFQQEAGGQMLRNYTEEQDLPWYPSLLLPHTPNYGDVVALASMDESNQVFLILGLTGGNHGNMLLE